MTHNHLKNAAEINLLQLQLINNWLIERDLLKITYTEETYGDMAAGVEAIALAAGWTDK